MHLLTVALTVATHLALDVLTLVLLDIWLRRDTAATPTPSYAVSSPTQASMGVGSDDE